MIVKDVFKEVGGIAECIGLNALITEAQHWFSTHAMKGLIDALAEVDEPKKFIWPVCTRFCGLLLKIKRFREMRDLLRRVATSGVYVEKNFLEDKVKPEIVAADPWALMDRVIEVMGPLLLLCRLADGQKPVMSKLYGTQLYVKDQMQTVAEATPEGSVERKIFAVFTNRWPGLQSDIAQATYCLDPLFVDKSKTAAGCIIKLWQLARKVIKKHSQNHKTRPLAPPPHTHTRTTPGDAGD